MKRSNRLLILLGVLLAIAGGVGALLLANGSGGGGGGGTGPGPAAASASATAEPTVQVVVAKVPINLGDQITADMVGTKTVTVSQRAALGQGTFSSVDQVVGKIAGGKIAAGQVLIGSRDLLTPGSVTDGTDIAGAIAPGMVAVSMEVDQTTGVGTLIVPGDQVDIILSVYSDQISITAQDANKNTITLTGGPLTHPTTKMVIQDGKVLATLVQPVQAVATAAPAAGATPAPTAAPTTPLVQLTGRHMMLIIQVAPDEAEIINWAQREEQKTPRNYIDLSIALRSPSDNGKPPIVTPGITFKMLVDKYGVLPPDPRGILPADIARGVQW